MKEKCTFRRLGFQAAEVDTEKALLALLQKEGKNTPFHLKCELGRSWLRFNVIRMKLEAISKGQYLDNKYLENLPFLLDNKAVIKKVLDEQGFIIIGKLEENLMKCAYYYLWGCLGMVSNPFDVHREFKLVEEICNVESHSTHNNSVLDVSMDESKPALELSNLQFQFEKQLNLSGEESLSIESPIKRVNHETESLRDLLTIHNNDKVLLQEIIQLTEKTIPKYITTSSQPFSAKVEIIVRDTKYIYKSSGGFQTKKAAEQSAARTCLINLVDDADLRMLIEYYRAEKKRKGAIS